MTTPSQPLASLHCIPCEEGTAPLLGASLAGLLSRLRGDWSVVQEHHLEKTFRFRNFREALDFTNAAGEVAEQEGHHPEITLAWGRVTIRIWTHKIDGLTDSDFILAAKIDEAFLGRGRAQP